MGRDESSLTAEPVDLLPEDLQTDGLTCTFQDAVICARHRPMTVFDCWQGIRGIDGVQGSKGNMVSGLMTVNCTLCPDASNDVISCLKQGSPGEIGAPGQQGNPGILVRAQEQTQNMVLLYYTDLNAL